jgi:hypothetical protein
MSNVASWGERYDSLRNACITEALANAATVARDDAWKAAAEMGPSSCQQAYCDLLRDIFGNPCRPVALNPRWRAPDVLGLARAAYEERDLPAGTFDGGRLAALADALLDAGCEDEMVLAHCRGTRPHVRGCWVVDWILDNA